MRQIFPNPTCSLHVNEMCTWCPVWVRRIAISVCVCVCVCLFACVSEKPHVQTLPNFAVHVVRGFVYLSFANDNAVLCTSGFVYMNLEKLDAHGVSVGSTLISHGLDYLAAF